MDESRKKLNAKTFVDEYKRTKDLVEAARLISDSTNKYTLAQAGRKMLADPYVQELLATEDIYDRVAIAKALTDIITGAAGTTTVDQKIKAAGGLEKLTRFKNPDQGSDFDERFERFLVDYGDILEEFVDGDQKKFNEFFQPKMVKNKVVFNVKKNDPQARRKLSILLQTLISQNVFS